MHSVDIYTQNVDIDIKVSNIILGWGFPVTSASILQCPEEREDPIL